MKHYNNLIKVFAITATALAFLINPLVHAGVRGKNSQENRELRSLYTHFQKYPWLALAMNEIDYGPFTIWDVHLKPEGTKGSGSPLVIVNPEGNITGTLRYYVDAEHLKALHRYHLVVGIKGIGAQDCITHTWGIWSGNGSGAFSLKAPPKPGIYEVRFVYYDATTCEDARSIWNNNTGEPSSFATIGVIIVK